MRWMHSGSKSRMGTDVKRRGRRREMGQPRRSMEKKHGKSLECMVE
jgi:hypothetical protein